MAFALWNGKDLYCPTCANSGRKAKLHTGIAELGFKCQQGHSFTVMEIAEIKNNNLVEAT